MTIVYKTVEVEVELDAEELDEVLSDQCRDNVFDLLEAVEKEYSPGSSSHIGVLITEIKEEL